MAKEHDRRHTIMLFNMPQMEQREESHHATFWRIDCVTSQKNICVHNKLEFVHFFSRGVTRERNCDTAGVLGMLKQNFSFRALKLCYRNLNVTEKAIQMM